MYSLFLKAFDIDFFSKGFSTGGFGASRGFCGLDAIGSMMSDRSVHETARYNHWKLRCFYARNNAYWWLGLPSTMVIGCNSPSSLPKSSTRILSIRRQLTPYERDRMGIRHRKDHESYPLSIHWWVARFRRWLHEEAEFISAGNPAQPESGN